MHFSRPCKAALLALPLSASAFTEASAVSRRAQDPCAALTDALSAAPGPLGATLVQPSVVYACQQSITVNETLVSAQIESLKAFLQFQSTLKTVIHPPASYLGPAVDLYGDLDAIAVKAEQSQYKSHYDVEYDIYRAVTKVSDGHLHVGPCLINAFIFVTQVNLVSVSVDGLQKPEVYFLSDWIGALHGGASPSPLRQVDGMAVDDFILSVGFYGTTQDPDAQYNFVQYNPASIQSINNLSPSPLDTSSYFGLLRSVFHNDVSNYTFANGSTVPMPNVAYSNLNLNITSGADFFDQYLLGNCSSPAPASASANASSDSAPLPTNLTGFPTANKTAAGAAGVLMTAYLPEIENLTDTTIISVPTFEDYSQGAVDMQNSVRDVLATSRAQGRTKLLIDVRSNGGGSIGLARDLMHQIFPNITINTGYRLRYSAAMDLMGQGASKLDLRAKLTPQESTAVTSPFAAGSHVDRTTQQPLTSWLQMVGPVDINGDQFAKIAPINLQTPDKDIAVLGIVPSGYGNNTSLAPQVFAAENVTILTDGYCASACADFVYNMIEAGGARSIAIGGRPNDQPMAIIGGTLGGETLTFSQLQSIANASTGGLPVNDSSPLAPLLKGTPLSLYGGLGGGSVNAEDVIRLDDSTQTPLQFGSIKADCRTYYTPKDIAGVLATWQRVMGGVESGGRGVCINGTVPAWSMDKLLGNGSMAQSSSAGTIIVWGKKALAVGVAAALCFFW